MDDWNDLMNKASIDDIKRWRADIEADERGLFKRDYGHEFDVLAAQQELQSKYEKLRKETDDAKLLQILKLAGIQKTLKMTDEEFLERGRRALKTAQQKAKRKKYLAPKNRKTGK